MFVDYRGERFGHTVYYNNDILDDSNEMAIPDRLPPIPATSGCDVKNISLSAVLSEDGGSLVVTLKNISEAPVEVHKGIFDEPLIYLGWNDKSAGRSYYWQAAMGDAERADVADPKTLYPVTTLAPDETLNYTATIGEIAKRLYISTWDKINFKDVNPEAEFVFGLVRYWSLFPCPPDVIRVETTVDAYATLGTVGAFREKYAELFKAPEPCQPPDTAETPTPTQPAAH